jgi:hypothetical protein
VDSIRRKQHRLHQTPEVAANVALAGRLAHPFITASLSLRRLDPIRVLKSRPMISCISPEPAWQEST